MLRKHIIFKGDFNGYTMQKTKFGSYCVNGIAEGCRFCVRGSKLVLFITGICSRNCAYCSLSEKRKSKDKVWANEREIKNSKELLEEARESNAKGAGITGGDPFLRLEKTLKYAKILKKEFGKSFHVHIYLPTKLSNKEKLKRLAKDVDEVRFHPEFLCKRLDETEMGEEIEKIKAASLIFGKKNTGIELPMLPERKKEILDFIRRVSKHIGFVNLNELEIGDINFEYITNKYKMDKEGYTVKGSIEAGKWILKQIEKEKLKLKTHLCTAYLKNWHQYQNRLRLHKIQPYGKRTKEGNVVYLAVYAKNAGELKKLEKELKKFGKIHIDKRKNRVILKESTAKRILGKYVIRRVEEYPTYDGIEIESEDI